MKYVPKNPKMVGLQGKSLESRCKAKFKMTLPQYLANCRSQGMSLQDTAKSLGCKRYTLSCLIRKLGVDWPSPISGDNLNYYGVLINGVLDYPANHCKRAGVTHASVQYYMKLHELGFPEALTIAIARKQRASTRDSGQSCPPHAGTGSDV